MVHERLYSMNVDPDTAGIKLHLKRIHTNSFEEGVMRIHIG